VAHDLFRREALEAKGNAFLGRAVLRPPLSFAAWGLIAGLLAAAVVAFLLVGEYTKRTRVVGLTAPDSGLIKLLAPQPGLVVERRVVEGQSVKAGDVLFVLSAERLTGSSGAVLGSQALVLDQLRRRHTSLDDEQARQRQLLAEQGTALRRKLGDLTEQGAQLEHEIATQQERVGSSRAQLQRYEDLARQQFMSEIAVQQKREEALDQQSRLQALERNRTAIRSDVATAAAELKQLPLKAEQQRGEVERSIAALEQDLASTEASRQIVITAPQDGLVTAILTDKGQMAGMQPLATLLPADGKLEAHLFAPSRAVGFVEPGQPVRLRYAAYPYQKFGQYEGTVVQVSRIALAANEVPPQLSALAQQTGAEGVYQITVQIASPTVLAYGKPQPLTAGMQLEADILQDTRTLIEWVFEPLVSLRGKV
jgi:membrane fusion protein